MSKVAMTAIIIAALTCACGHDRPVDGPTTYYATADVLGWATARIDGYAFGDLVDVTAWHVRYYNDGDPVLWQLGQVAFMLDGSVGVQTEPYAEVVFIVTILGGDR